ncbi:hypothetical protein DRW03_34235 [Corallococcus sp. H22C18031201]|uniref:hypothetical protein n=1 Tax=Citreicoccus inhibens TaxID=2849499 RepID=UPI000E728DA9|nr:hypothetical protein [Citreicoccus inhibens]MBU8896685.1 hypothetical protein [Citreicoccus inhibens]RJS14723.1 hypothetical protein DRW03_34235 [Corallococcus sp. H22C18031201]
MISLDDSLWPLLIARFEGPHSPDEFEAYLDRAAGYFRRREPMVMLVDARDAVGMPPAQRQRQAEWQRQHESVLRHFNQGTAFVITSPAVRLSLNVILALRPLVAPHVVVPTLRQAIGWAADRFEETGHRFPALRLRTALLGSRRGSG